MNNKADNDQEDKVEQEYETQDLKYPRFTRCIGDDDEDEREENQPITADSHWSQTMDV